MKGWAVDRLEDGVRLSRAGRGRTDVYAEAELPGAYRSVRLAHAIRQDVWRAVQRVRGFSPVVTIRKGSHSVTVIAGGQMDGRADGALAARIGAVLESPANRARWARWAGVRP